jgi:hypothetical protein
VACPSASECLAVGASPAFGSTQSALSERWTGSSWSVVAMPTLPSRASELNGVACSAANACTTVGTQTVPGAINSLAERWNGSGWVVQATFNNEGAGVTDLEATSCPGPTTCMAVGRAEYGNDAEPLAELWS